MTTNELTMLWAKIKSYFTGLFVKKTDFANYDPLIEDTRTSAAAVITANAPFATLEDGQRVTLKLNRDVGVPTAGYLRLTLSDGTLTQDLPIYLSMFSSGHVMAGTAGTAMRTGQLVPLMFDANGNYWKTVGDIDHSRSFAAYDSSTIKSTTNNNTGTVSAKILHEEFATNTALAGKADKVEVVDVEQTYTLVVTATASYVANQSQVDEVIDQTFYIPAADRTALKNALHESIADVYEDPDNGFELTGFVPAECTVSLTSKEVLDDMRTQTSRFFSYTATVNPYTIEPNKVYNFDYYDHDHGMRYSDEINIVLGTSGSSTDLKIYCFTFTAESAACQVTLPASVELGNEYEWEFAAGRKFEVSIMDNMALVAYVDTQTTNS